MYKHTHTFCSHTHTHARTHARTHTHLLCLQQPVLAELRICSHLSHGAPATGAFVRVGMSSVHVSHGAAACRTDVCVSSVMRKFSEESTAAPAHFTAHLASSILTSKLMKEGESQAYKAYIISKHPTRPHSPSVTLGERRWEFKAQRNLPMLNCNHCLCSSNEKL